MSRLEAMRTKLWDASEEFGALEAVHDLVLESDDPSRVGSPWLVGVALRFEGGWLLISADGTDDTVEVRTLAAGLAALHWPRGPDERLVPTSYPVWNGALGCELLWAWGLLNQRGYVDGVQFEFTPKEAGASAMLQLVVLGSQFVVYELRRHADPVS